MKKVTLLIIFLISVVGFSQKKVNNYKYIIIPERLNFLDKSDQYKTSSLTKFLFNKSGYRAYLSSDIFPQDLGRDRCLALRAIVHKVQSFMATKTYIELTDCYNNKIYTSEVGRSKLKDHQKSYHEAIRGAFESIKKLNYKHIPFKEEIDINKDKAIVEVVKKNKPVMAVTTKNTTTIIKKEEKIEEKKESISTLYAQPKDYGFQLVDNTPKVVFKILKTEKKGLFIIKDRNGILYQKEGKWVAEYYTGEVLVKETFQIKF